MSEARTCEVVATLLPLNLWYSFININQIDALNFITNFVSSLYMFRAHVIIVRRAKLYYTVSGIITHIGGRPVHGTATHRCDDTRDCITQFWLPDNDHTCSKHVEAWNKLIIKFSASIWLILINKYIEVHGQQNIKIYDIKLTYDNRYLQNIKHFSLWTFLVRSFLSRRLFSGTVNT